MSFAPGIGSVSIEAFNTNTNRLGYITFGLNVGLTPSGEDLQTALEAFMTDIIQDCSAAIISRGALITINAPGSGTGTRFVPFTDTLNGSLTTVGSPPQIAYLYRKTTDVVGRMSYGRFYLPGVVDAKIDDTGRVDSSFLTSQRNHATSALAALNTASSVPYTMLLLHRNSSDPTTVTGLAPEPFVATQRRRLVRAGA